jgi:EAL domain-containing protein (putative c-di-GMP-specific phosphodiesterase class I)
MQDASDDLSPLRPGTHYRPVMHLGTRSVVGWQVTASGEALEPSGTGAVDAAVAALVWADRVHGPSRRFAVVDAPRPGTAESIDHVIDRVIAAVATALADTPVTAERLWVTAPATSTIAALGALRDLGVHVALRDATGGEAVAALHRGAPFDRLLLHIPAGEEPDDARRGATVLRSLVMLATELGAEVVVEGLALREHLSLVQLAGAPLGTGSWFGEPADRPEAVAGVRTINPMGVSLQPTPPFEAERMDVVRASGILDSRPEQLFDHLVLEAAAAFEVPIALVSVIDSHRQWAKALIGPPELAQLPRQHSLCAHTICGIEPLVITDALDAERFARLRPVSTAPGVRFYAGAPMLTSDGLALGAVGVADTVPHPPPTAAQLALLERLAHVAAQCIELRARLVQLRRAAVTPEVIPPLGRRRPTPS